jgi:hypothetical protein
MRDDFALQPDAHFVRLKKVATQRFNILIVVLKRGVKTVVGLNRKTNAVKRGSGKASAKESHLAIHKGCEAAVPKLPATA